MKYLTATVLGLSLSVSACAEQDQGTDATPVKQTQYEMVETEAAEKNEGRSENIVPSIIRDSGDIFMIITNTAGKTEANYFSTHPSNPEELAKKITWILKQAKVSNDIIEFAETRLPKNRRLKKDDFTLPLTGEDGSKYQFNYTSNIEQNFYSINYKKM